MKIIATNRDYYDSVLWYGQDESVVYRRFEEVHRGGHLEPIHSDFDFMRTGLRNRNTTTKKKVEFDIESFTIAFCGKIYPGIRVVKNPAELNPESKFFYDNESYIECMKEHGIVFRKPSKWRMSYISDFADLAFEKTSEDFFKRSGDDTHLSFFAEKKIPVAVWYREPDEDWRNSQYVMRTNCELRHFNFQKVFDPWQAFQEISMFVGGCMVGDEAAMARVDDEHMMLKKGFDHPYSFRKEPTKKR